MRLVSARLKGLIGVYRASGKKEIFIDFNKCKNKLTLIIGKNGSGKSTIWNALQPLPDSLSDFLPKMEGGKELVYELEDGVRYIIKISYPVNTLGDRTKTTANITKVSNGVEVELNPNGNVGSYKDVLFSEFKLDPNFVQLSQLSSENSGMARKTPSERKKYVNSILDNVEVYNNIGKTLTKRSSTFKAMINSIVAKIDNIGDAESLNAFLTGAENRLSRLENEEKSLTKSLSDLEAHIKIIDPDGSIQNKYSQIYSKFTALSEDIKMVDNILTKLASDGYESLEYSLTRYTELNKEIAELDKDIYSIQNELSNLLLSREEESKLIQIKSDKLLVLTSNIDYDSLNARIKTLKANIQNYLSFFKSIGIDNYTSITKDEFISGLNILRSIKDIISNIKSSCKMDNFVQAIEMILSGVDVAREFNNAKGKLDRLKTQYNDNQTESMYWYGVSNSIKILNDRPKECKIDSCPFVSKAIEDSKYEPDTKLKDLEKEGVSLQEEISSLEKRIEDLTEIFDIYNQLLLAKRYIENNNGILSKLPNSETYSNVSIFFRKLLDGHSFNDIDNLYCYIDRANMFELYTADMDQLSKCENDMRVYSSKQEIINEIQSDIADLTTKISNITKTVEDTNRVVSEKSFELESLKQELSKCNSAIDTYKKAEELYGLKKDLKNQLDSIISDMSVIEKYIQSINELNSQLNNLSVEKKTLTDDIYKTKFSLKQLEDYTSELNEYKTKYDYVETIRKYSTPTKDGIQTIFMLLYMGKTLSMANELLSLFFNGDLELGQPDINATEFKIPCKSNISSVVNDDINSCSSGEKAMIDMILSFTFLHQSSTIYNILRLDEIDGPLDQNNRASFIIALNKIMGIFDVQNCIMISHSSEIELKDVDIILLKPVDNNIPDGNIIFSYSD